MIARPLNEHGLTLTEVAVVAAIGTLVLLGIGGFYLNSQATWLDASSQSVTQREATLVCEAIADSVAGSAVAQGQPVPDADHGQIHLYRRDPDGTLQGTPFWCYWWEPSDSLVHHGPDPANDDRGPMLASKVERFRIEADAALVQVSLSVRAPRGERIDVSTTTLMRNR